VSLPPARPSTPTFRREGETLMLKKNSITTDQPVTTTLQTAAEKVIATLKSLAESEVSR
jgi:hypothetical protein